MKRISVTEGGLSNGITYWGGGGAQTEKILDPNDGNLCYQIWILC